MVGGFKSDCGKIDELIFEMGWGRAPWRPTGTITAGCRWQGRLLHTVSKNLPLHEETQAHISIRKSPGEHRSFVFEREGSRRFRGSYVPISERQLLAYPRGQMTVIGFGPTAGNSHTAHRKRGSHMQDHRTPAFRPPVG